MKRTRIFLIALLWMGPQLGRAAVIDFDAAYGGASGWTLVDHINSAVQSASPGDIIQFNSASYDFQGQGLSLDKGLTFRGIVPAGFDPETVGATNVTTVFANLKHLNVTSSDVTLRHLELQEDASTTYAFNRFKRTIPAGQDPHQFYTNIVVENVVYRGGQVQAYGGDGAGIEFRNTSFLDFRATGYGINRQNRIDYAPHVGIRKCFFKPDFNAVNFNVRAISLDAGNSEYPVVWDQNNTLIEGCLLDGTGLGLGSKCSNVIVTNCHFKGYRMDVDMLHIEEFGSGYEIVGNTFEHVSPARGIYIDREMQQNRDIRIAGNTWVGEYGWIISCYSPEGVLFEDNDFSGAWASDPNDITIDFTYLHDTAEEAYLPYDTPSSNLVFRNNTGLNETKDGVLAYTYLLGDSSIQIDYPTNKVQKTFVTEVPRSVFSQYKWYRFKNKQSGAYIAAIDGSTELGMIPSAASDGSDLWAMSYKYAYFYPLRNVKTGRYMEVWKAYTLGDLQSGNQPQRFVEQAYSYAGKADVPFWYFRKHESGTGAFYELFPGSNERKSRVVQVGNHVEIEFATASGSGALPPEDDSSWILEAVDLGIPAQLSFAGQDVILGMTNGPAHRWFSVISKTNLTDATWMTNQTDLAIDALGSASVTNPSRASREFYMLIETDEPPPPVIEFVSPDYSDGALNGQQGWKAEAGWTVGDAAGLGHIKTLADMEGAVINTPIQLNVGDTYFMSINLEFGGAFAPPTGFVYAFLGGIKENAAGASVGTGSAAADANIQLVQNSDTYRLLNNWSPIGAPISGAPLNAGDVLQFDYELTRGLDAASTVYTVRLRNLTDGTDTGLGTVVGIDASIYNALAGGGAYGFFQSIAPGGNGAGLSGVTVHSVSTNRLP